MIMNVVPQNPLVTTFSCVGSGGMLVPRPGGEKACCRVWTVASCPRREFEGRSCAVRGKATTCFRPDGRKHAGAVQAVVTCQSIAAASFRRRLSHYKFPMIPKMKWRRMRKSDAVSEDCSFLQVVNPLDCYFPKVFQSVLHHRGVRYNAENHIFRVDIFLRHAEYIGPGYFPDIYREILYI